MLDRVFYPKPRDAFGSTRRRTEVYGIELDVDEYDDEAESEPQPEEAEVDDSEWVKRDCEHWARSFLQLNDLQHLVNILHSLKPEHRQHLIRCLVSNALYSEDMSVAARIGSLYTIRRIYDLCQGGELFVRGMQDELAMLADVLLDVPIASQLVVQVLRSMRLPLHELEGFVLSAIPNKELSRTLMSEMESVVASDAIQRISSGSSDEDRLNRFERSSSGASSPAAKQTVILT